MASWFHGFRGVDSFKDFIVSMVSWCHGFIVSCVSFFHVFLGFYGFMVS